MRLYLYPQDTLPIAKLRLNNIKLIKYRCMNKEGDKYNQHIIITRIKHIIIQISTFNLIEIYWKTTWWFKLWKEMIEWNMRDTEPFVWVESVGDGRKSHGKFVIFYKDYMEVWTELGKTWSNMVWKWVGTMLWVHHNLLFFSYYFNLFVLLFFLCLRKYQV